LTFVKTDAVKNLEGGVPLMRSSLFRPDKHLIFYLKLGSVRILEGSAPTPDKAIESGRHH
jgi:hypothetical protein